jgi:crotonobetainyl-CoA:carnitine CoA-transferase CaiB-like acyl-CoA transferase
LQQLNPRMIYLSITGFGQDGPYTKARVYDAVIQAVSGMCASHLEKPGGEPGLVATTICDKLTAMTAAQAVTAALLAREHDGRARVIERAGETPTRSVRRIGRKSGPCYGRTRPATAI